MLKERNERDKARITVVSPEPPGSWLGGMGMARALRNALEAHDIELLPDFRITGITSKQVATSDGVRKDYDLLMLVPPFRGAPALTGMGITDEEGFVCVDSTMRVRGVDGMYAVGDCVNFSGPKLGHMAVMQAEVAAHNLVSELKGAEPNKQYRHEITMIIDEGGSHSIFLQKHSLEEDKGNVKQARFWSWAKRIHEKYWQFEHS